MGPACVPEYQESQEVAPGVRPIVVSGCYLLNTFIAEISKHQFYPCQGHYRSDLSDSEEVGTRSRAPQPATRSGVSVRRLVFDLTVETEHCTICSNVLGEGSDYSGVLLAH
jgi:hypothetical protein